MAARESDDDGAAAAGSGANSNRAQSSSPAHDRDRCCSAVCCVLLLSLALTQVPPSLSSIQCLGAFKRFMCFFGPRAMVGEGGWSREQKQRTTGERRAQRAKSLGEISQRLQTVSDSHMDDAMEMQTANSQQNTTHTDSHDTRWRIRKGTATKPLTKSSHRPRTQPQSRILDHPDALEASRTCLTKCYKMRHTCGFCSNIRGDADGSLSRSDPKLAKRWVAIGVKIWNSDDRATAFTVVYD